MSGNYKQSKGRIEMEVFFKEPLVVKRRPTHGNLVNNNDGSS